jgi:hypothetical protein
VEAPDAPDLDGWTPIRVSVGEAGPVVDWCHTAGVDFDDPFFDQAVERALRHPFRLLFRRETTVDELVERAAVAPGLAPSGFVLHLSRCGSTLAARMLGALPTTLVLSEPGPLDAVLRTGRPDWVRAMVAALGQPRRPGHSHLVVKLDAWALLHLPVLAAAFPATPWVVLHRDPVEVLVSQLRRRGWHMVPGALPPALVGLAPEQAVTLPQEDYAAAVLGALCRAAARHHDPARARLVDHADLPGAVADVVAPWFGVEVDAAGRSAMLAVAGQDAKNPVLPYADDRAAKQAGATASVRAAADRWVAGAYGALVALGEGR